MPGGRPTIYSEELLNKAKEYFLDWKNIDPEDVIPTIEGLSLFMGVSRQTLYVWSKEEGKEEFSDIFSRIMSQQGKILANQGLNGKFSPVITKVMLTKHDYREGVESDITSGGKPLEKGLISIIDKVYDKPDGSGKDAGDGQGS